MSIWKKNKSDIMYFGDLIQVCILCVLKDQRSLRDGKSLLDFIVLPHL